MTEKLVGQILFLELLLMSRLRQCLDGSKIQNWAPPKIAQLISCPPIFEELSKKIHFEFKLTSFAKNGSYRQHRFLNRSVGGMVLILRRENGTLPFFLICKLLLKSHRLGT